MGDVLSQNEIDSLLQALTSGELDVDEIKESSEKQVKDYDFARPSKFSKEHLRTLEIIFEHYGRLLSTNLPVYLRNAEPGLRPDQGSAQGGFGRGYELGGGYLFRVLQCIVQSGFAWNYQFCPSSGQYYFRNRLKPWVCHGRPHAWRSR